MSWHDCKANGCFIECANARKATRKPDKVCVATGRRGGVCQGGVGTCPDGLISGHSYQLVGAEPGSLQLLALISGAGRAH